MNPGSVEKAAENLRRAITLEEYRSVESLVIEYCDAVRQRLTGYSRGDAQRVEALEQTLDMLQWARIMVGAGRSSCAEDLSFFKRVRSYENGNAQPEPAPVRASKLRQPSQP